MKEKKPKKGFLEGYNTYDVKTEGFGTPSSWKSAFNERMGYEEATDFLRSAKNEIPFAVEMRAAKTLAELKSIYRTAMKRHHPDVGGDTEIAKSIVALYTVLKENF